MVSPCRMSQLEHFPLPQQDPPHVRHVPEVTEGLRPARQTEEPPPYRHHPEVHLYDLGTRKGHGTSSSCGPGPLRPHRRANCPILHGLLCHSDLVF